MNNLEFLEQLELALNSPTLYATGAFGAPTGVSNNTDRYYENTKKNLGKKYADRIKAADKGTFLFDCIGLGKGIAWDWCSDGNVLAAQSKRYGGAIYKYNDIPDFSIKSLHKYCDWTESDCTNPDEIEIGEWLRTSDNSHVAYYAGNGWIIESTPSGTGGVQKTLLASREWNGHGKLNYIEYVKTQVSEVGQVVCPHCGCLFKLFA